MPKGKQKRPQPKKLIDETSYLSCRRPGAVLKEECFHSNRVVSYSLAYINPKVYGGDNGRVLGYDNAHGPHHRHFMGRVKNFEFEGYEELVSRFEGEVHELWRLEDEQKGKS